MTLGNTLPYFVLLAFAVFLLIEFLRWKRTHIPRESVRDMVEFITEPKFSSYRSINRALIDHIEALEKAGNKKQRRGPSRKK